MSRLYRAAIMAASAVALCVFESTAHASVIVSGDPDGVFPGDLQENPNVVGSDIAVAWYLGGNFNLPRNGSLIVSAEGDKTAVSTDQNLLVGASGFLEGDVTVLGDGTAGSASITAKNAHVGGYTVFAPNSQGAGSGSLSILNGGTLILQPDGFTGGELLIGARAETFVNAGEFTVSNEPQDANGIVFVTGSGSRIEGRSIQLGNSVFGTTGVLSVSDGGQVALTNSINLSAGSGLIVDGSGSSLDANGVILVGNQIPSFNGVALEAADIPALLSIVNGGKVTTGRSLDVGFGGASGAVSLSGAGSELSVTGSTGGVISAGDILIGARSGGGSAVMTVFNDAKVTAARDIYVGGNDPYSNSGDPAAWAVLGVSQGGRVEAQRLFVRENGLLEGSSGIIDANVIIDGGTLSPGNSPGQMSIDGNLEFTGLDSVLTIEIAGTQAGEFDVLDVLGDLIAPTGFTLELSFLNGFTPETGDSFTFLNVAGSSALDLAMLNVITQGLGSGVEYAFNFLNGSFSLDILSAQEPSEVPLPAALPLMLAGLAGLSFAARKRRRA